MSYFDKLDVFTLNKIYSYVYDDCMKELLTKTLFIKNLLNAQSASLFSFGMYKFNKPRVNMFNLILLKYYMLSMNDINNELIINQQRPINLLTCIRCDILKQSYRDLFNIHLL